MLTRVDRVQVVVADRGASIVTFRRLLDAAVIREDRVCTLATRRTVLRLGGSDVEVLEPDGAGVVADFLSQMKGGLFAVGFATADLPGLKAHMEKSGVRGVEEGGQLLLSPEALRLPGLRAVISSDNRQPPAGLLRHLYEATLLVDNSADVARQAAATFGLDPAHFVPIRSAEFGYGGALTLFHPDRLDRIEIVTPTDPAKTMGRFFAKRGASLYMCYAEATDLKAVRARLLEHAPYDWSGPRDTDTLDNLFIHPKALGGMMLGVSRTSVGWMWSGRPERVAPALP